MDLVKAEQLNAPFQGMVNLPVLKQAGLLVGLAASIALGVAIVLWSRSPDYSILYSSVTGQSAQEMVQVLSGAGIDYRLDPDSGTLMVDSDKLHQAKLKLAAANLTQTDGVGFELLEDADGFGSSSFMQNARFHRAQEGELARTISSITAVQTARVHLALPKQSAFIRSQRQASASVMLKLRPGRQLEKQQINAIVNLVSSSVPNMIASDVTIVDDQGRLLSSGKDQEGLALTASQFDHTRKVEDSYASRVENILTPLVGRENVRATVSADLDFTRTESTREAYNPDAPAVRSEQSFEEEVNGPAIAGGIPGALTNTPPGQARAPEEADAAAGEQVQTEESGQVTRRSTRNYELDRTISHSRNVPGSIRRLSVAVVLDVKQVADDEGNPVATPYTDAELARFTTLVKEAVGFNAVRGDSVQVINAEFTPPVQLEEVPAESFWEKPGFWSILKQVGGALLALLILFGVLRPVMRSLASHRPTRIVDPQTGEELSEDQLSLSGGGGGQPRLPKAATYEDNLNMARQLAAQEPKRVAQVVKSWLDDK
ncbi:flagellar basal-body MS-ring/collar protein FliF [Thiohalophilus sp.]|uniref:flagellar basal-body MS-ring/collar protein FliF n=1 Tax=Thiohalophilus sp. TaxID=3028392 RepID=UPI002ACE0CFD|nr:flagellar basal-body MS-ring/collar protein FliF [Thiohalophilus sp.]MDZ7802635.1 flagellar basal-body MS-ring/collar protein FliF [Thiohalophilus sp.]